MAFVVEDGTGLADANSLVSVEEFLSYWSDRGQTFTSSNPVIQTWLIAATDYVNGFRYKYQPLNDAQACAFPRDCVGLPEKIKQAVFQYAIRAKDGPLNPDPTVDASGLQVVSAKKVIGPLEKTLTYSENRQAAKRKSYPEADRLLLPYVMSNSRTYR